MGTPLLLDCLFMLAVLVLLIDMVKESAKVDLSYLKRRTVLLKAVIYSLSNKNFGLWAEILGNPA